jgi:tRNA dimethylallyltransferase
MGAILGATASGKSEFAVLLAQELGAEIICMDSRQVYKGFIIGTAQPTAEEKKAVSHHLVDFLPPEKQYNAAEFAKDVKSILAQNIDKKFILTGGTGLYMQALCQGLSPQPPSNPRLREKLKKQYEGKSEDLYNDALKMNPDIAGKIKPNDTQRLMGTLELAYNNSQFSILNSQLKRVGGIGSLPSVWLDFPRDELYKRINERTVRMLKNGWAEEVMELSKTVPLNAPAWQSLGYLELKNALENNKNPLSIADEIALKSRHYAKRQITWFKHKETPVYVDGSSVKENIQKIIRSLISNE